jgi:hypothetical protein
MKWKGFFAAILLSFTLVLAGNVSAKTLTINQGTASILLLDPQVERSSTAINFFFSSMFDTLLMNGKKMEIEPMLATSCGKLGRRDGLDAPARKGLNFTMGHL